MAHVFNIDKCKMMHFGKDNPNFEYEMSDNQGVTKNLTSVEYEKDLGKHFQDNLKFDRHISLTVNIANRLVGLIKHAFSFLNKETLLTNIYYMSFLLSTFKIVDKFKIPKLRSNEVWN